MKIRDLINALSEYDPEMDVVFRTYEQFEIDDYETDTESRDHDIRIYASETKETSAWETREVAPYVVIELED